MKGVKTLALLLALVLVVGLFGCTNKPADATNTPVTTDGQETDNQQAGENLESAAPSDNILPLTEGAEFSMWYQFTLMTTVITSYNDSEVFKELEKLTGVHIDFIHPSMTDMGVSAFSLLMASQDYPDTFFTFPMVWTAGLDKYIEDEILIDLDDYVHQYAPNLAALLEAHPDLRRDSYTDSGKLPGFTQIQYQSEPGYTAGTAVRADIMDNLGIETPVTYDDFHDMLAAMKDATGMYLDLIPDQLSLMAGYNVCGLGANANGEFMRNADGEIVFTYTQDGFRKYLSTMNKWFEEGLVNPDFMTSTSNDTVNLATTGKICASNLLFATNIGKSAYDTGATQDPNFNLRAVPFPKESVDTVIHVGSIDGYVYEYGYRSAYQVSTVAEDPVLITKWFDYMYSDEGILLTNYGFEGETFEYDENGNPCWTELIYNNPDGRNIAETQQMYLWHFPPFSDFDKETRTYVYEEQREAGSIWFDTDLIYALPTGFSFTQEEGTRYSAIYNDIDTYANEMMLGFIAGQSDVNDDSVWDAYVSQVESMNIDEVIDILESAYARYYAR